MLSELELSKLKKIFAEICSGRSLYNFKNKNVFVKHFGFSDDLEVDFFYQNKYKKLQKSGIFTEKQKLDYLLKNGFWAEEKEKKIKFAQETLFDLYQNKSKVSSFADIEFYKTQIKENEEFLWKIIGEKIELIGDTCETSARKSADLVLIQKSFFQDKNLTIPLFPEDEFEDLSAQEIGELYEFYNQIATDLSEKNFQKITIQPFFNNIFFLSENSNDFFGGSITSLTHHQTKILTWGRFFSGILKNSNVPADIQDDPQKIIDWTNGKKNLEEIIQRNTDENGKVSLVGVSKQEMKFYGLDDPAATAQDQKLSKELAKTSSGELSLEESVKLGFI